MRFRFSRSRPPCMIPISFVSVERLAGGQRHERAELVGAPLGRQGGLPPRLAVIAEPELERPLVRFEPDVNAFGGFERLIRAVEILGPDAEDEITHRAERRWIL